MKPDFPSPLLVTCCFHISCCYGLDCNPKIHRLKPKPQCLTIFGDMVFGEANLKVWKGHEVMPDPSRLVFPGREGKTKRSLSFPP